jgi:DNA-directed RNA polymerase subunit RPC12/RpoP
LNEETNHPNNSYELSESNVETQNGLNSYHIPSSGSITIASSDEAFIGKEVVIDIPSFNKVKDKELKYNKRMQKNQDKNNLYTLVDQKTGREFAQKNVCHDEQVIQIVPGNQEAVHLIVSSEKGGEIIEHTVPIEYHSTSSISKSEHYKTFPDVINIDDICEPLWVKTTNENEPDTIVVSVDSVLTPMKVPDITSKVRIGIFKCVFCTKEFSSRKTKIQHERNVHSSEGIHECSVCHKIFASVQYLRDHSKVHSETSLYQCSGYDEDCNKMFRSSKDLKRHVRGVHTGEKPYECLVCGKRFSASSNLSEHKTLHSGVMKYECRTCNKRFRLSSTLRKHELKNSCFKM